MDCERGTLGSNVMLTHIFVTSYVILRTYIIQLNTIHFLSLTYFPHCISNVRCTTFHFIDTSLLIAAHRKETS